MNTFNQGLNKDQPIISNDRYMVAPNIPLVRNRTKEEVISFYKCVKERLEEVAKQFGITCARVGTLEKAQDKPYEFIYDCEHVISVVGINYAFQGLENILETHNYNFHSIYIIEQQKANYPLTDLIEGMAQRHKIHLTQAVVRYFENSINGLFIEFKREMIKLNA
jgi:hypothetical protein